MLEQQFKTFEEMGVIFEEGSNCHTCMDDSCHNTVPSKVDGKEYSVHISTNKERSFFHIHATEESNTQANSDVLEGFENEREAVEFICTNYEWFKCF